MPISSALRKTIRRFVAEQSGSTAAEFVLILVPLVALVIGTINASLMLFSYTTLHFATEDAARCATARTSVCKDEATTESFAGRAYAGPGTPTFKYTQPLDANSQPLCNQVVGTLNYNFMTGITSMIVPLSAKACYPLG